MPKMDWQQVALNGGPPCFAVLDDEPEYYCGRAERWEGHDGDHEFISLESLLRPAATTPPDFTEQCNKCGCEYVQVGKVFTVNLDCDCDCHKNSATDLHEQARQLVVQHRQGRTHQPTYCCPEDEAFYERQLARDIASALAEAATLSGDEREMRGREYQAERINAWLDNPNRQPANIAFTAGSERWIAYRVEKLLDEAATQGQAAMVREIHNCEKCDLCEDHLP